ncbi:hypothetical protein NQT62_14000 [Limnobacter humi]|uniref:Uncharacterized protein n=1 Tax=Limnobacter humi TaxID=1778671 RepID=A0ABT1WJ61_9BURK|nr:hypothetical protein [Limnobacter humi]MCQ8897550.1 hypothetical protein [Limnobacter humi]
MSITSTSCRESQRVYELNAAYIQLIQHLQWNKQVDELAETLHMDADLLAGLAQADEPGIQDLLNGRTTTLFSLEVSATELTDLLAEQAERKVSVLGSLFTANSLMLEVAATPSRAFIKWVLQEIQSWSTFSTTTNYRFNCSQSVVEQIARLDAASVLKLAKSAATCTKPRFTAAHLQVLGKTGLVPVGLLFD